MIRKLKYFKFSRYAVRLGLPVLVFTGLSVSAQEVRKISLQEAVELGLRNSKELQVTRSRIDLALNRFRQAEEQGLPSASAGIMYNHAEFLGSGFRLPGSSEALHLPSNANAYIGTVSVEQLVFAGNRLRYAKESADLLTGIARLDAAKDSAEIAYSIISSYYNLYRLQQSQKVLTQSLASVDRQLKQAEQFFEQGVVTKNDVLRYQLQRSQIELTGLDLETNRKVVNYNFDILLGLPETTVVEVEEVPETEAAGGADAFIGTALSNRPELMSSDHRYRLAETNLKSVKSEMLPTVGVGGNLYFINPSGKFIPPSQTFLAPVAVAANLSWNIDKLWTGKTRISEARIQQVEAGLQRNVAADRIRSEVNRNFLEYRKALQRIGVLQVSVEQARENDRIMESKYRNNIASVTDRIDAETQLFQTLINLEISRADAGLAYYTLLKSTGTIIQSK
ncbi:MAG TPA: TolC family protein [Sphingobacteriaceae bacterium]